MQSVRTVVFGAGIMGGHHARALKSLAPVFSFEGVYDPDEGAADRLARACGGVRFKSVHCAIAAADLVVVATPIRTHAGLAHQTLKAGRHVLVEKPLCATSRDAYSLMVEALRGGGSLFVGHSERFNPAIRALRTFVAPHSIVSIETRRINGPPRGTEQNGALINLGVHDFDLVRMLTASAVKISAVTGKGRFDAAPSYTERMWIDDCAAVEVKTVSGAAGTIYVDRASPERQRTLRVKTADAIWDADLLNPALAYTSRVTGIASAVPVSSTSPLVAQALAMARTIAGDNHTGIATGEDGCVALRLAESAVRRIAKKSSATNGCDEELAALFGG